MTAHDARVVSRNNINKTLNIIPNSIQVAITNAATEGLTEVTIKSDIWNYKKDEVSRITNALEINGFHVHICLPRLYSEDRRIISW